MRLVEGGAVACCPFSGRPPAGAGERCGSRDCWAWPSIPATARTATCTSTTPDMAGHTAVVRYTARADGVRPTRAAPCPCCASSSRRTTTVATSSSGRTATCTSGLGDGGGAGDTYRNAQSPQSLLGKMLRLDVDRTEGGEAVRHPGGQSLPGTAPSGRRSGRWACAIPGATASTGPAATCTSPTWGRTPTRRWNVVPAGASGAPGLQLRLAADGGDALLSLRERLRPAGADPAGGRVRPGGATAPSPAGRSTGVSPCYAGAYLFGDYCSGRIWSLHRDGGGAHGCRRSGRSGRRGEQLRRGRSGRSLYLTGLSDGVLYRIVARPR